MLVTMNELAGRRRRRGRGHLIETRLVQSQNHRVYVPVVTSEQKMAAAIVDCAAYAYLWCFDGDLRRAGSAIGWTALFGGAVAVGSFLDA
jgi:hypothetical protein